VSSSSPAALSSREIFDAMRTFRARTLALVADLDDYQMIGPRLSIVNPPLWEIGHVAWFQEFWALRHLKDRKPRSVNSDNVYNSTDIPHDARWEILLPTRAETMRYMESVLDDCLELVNRPRELSSEERYFLLLALFHEGMHAEALAITRQTLAYPAPSIARERAESEYPPGPCPGDVEVPGGIYLIGATPAFPFVFDNEKWAHDVTVKSFRIARAPVTNREYLGFVESGGYLERKFWSPEGWHWLETGGTPSLDESFGKFFRKEAMHHASEANAKLRLQHPRYWKQSATGAWQQRVFDRMAPLESDLPVIHVSWYEAEAYCNWTGRRLPRESEWEIAASAERSLASSSADRRRYFPWGSEPPNNSRANLDWHNGGPVPVNATQSGDSALGCRQMLGNVWEWTADSLMPYPGFTADPYKEYSQPWFGTHKTLRGGCWATPSLLIRNTWRNFYTPDRADVWAGFRTCAL
jgi:gamma-glutamyl hercynylcysteine S-oxide synthase